MEHGSRSHAKFSASGANRWMNCNGSIRLSASVPKKASSSWAIDGTQAHELLEFALRNKYRDAAVASAAAMRFDAQERIDAVQVCLDTVYEILDLFPDAELYIEYEFKFPSQYTVDAGGHCDILIYIPSRRLLYVIDYKHGEGKYVEAVGNEQIQFYGVGGVQLMAGRQIDDVCLCIIQPRYPGVEPVRWWPIKISELMAFRDKVDQEIYKSLQPDSKLVAGEWCRWCPAASICPVLERDSLALTQTYFANVKDIEKDKLPDARQLSAEKIADILSKKKILEKWLESVENAAFELLKAGGVVPGFKLVESWATRKYNDDHEMVAQWLSYLIGVPVDNVYPRQLITITEAEDLIKKAARATAPMGSVKEAVTAALDKFATLTTKSTSGKFTMVADKDTRPAVNPTARLFANVDLGDST